MLDMMELVTRVGMVDLVDVEGLLDRVATEDMVDNVDWGKVNICTRLYTSPIVL